MLDDLSTPGYPVQLQLKGRLCVVVGAGAVGRRKVAGLLAAGGRVRVVDPRRDVVLPDGVESICRAFAVSDLDDAFLVFAATSDSQVNAAVVAAARSRGLLVNRADQPEDGDFSLPAVWRCGRLSVAAATDGASPALAKLLRDALAAGLDPAWGFFAELAAALRCWRLTSGDVGTYNQQVLQVLLDHGVLRLIAAGDTAGIDRLLSAAAGEGCSLADLGLRLEKGLP